MYLLILAALLLVHAFVPLLPVTVFDMFAPDTHWACVYILADVEDANEAICKPRGYFTDHDLSIIRSTNVRYCSEQECRAGICHARFNCEVMKDANSCTKEQLSEAISSNYVLRCGPNELVNSETRVWIDPRFENDPVRAIAHCVFKEYWARKTGTRWMETEERQYELQRVTAAAMDVVTDLIGSDLATCVDQFLGSQ